MLRGACGICPWDSRVLHALSQPLVLRGEGGIGLLQFRALAAFGKLLFRPVKVAQCRNSRGLDPRLGERRTDRGAGFCQIALLLSVLHASADGAGQGCEAAIEPRAM